MFNKVLVPLDLSKKALSILKDVKKFQSTGTKEIVILNVVDKGSGKSLQESLRTMGTEELKQRKTELEKLGFSVKTLVETGTPQTTILKTADSENVDAIFMTAQGQTFISRIVLGSVTNYVLHNSNVPVLIHKDPPKESPDSQYIFSKIMHPTDFSPTANRAFEYLKKFNPKTCEEIVLLHVQDTRLLDPHLMHRLNEFEKTDKERLEDMKTVLTEKGFENVDTIIELGVSISSICKLAKDKQISLIIMGTKGKSNVAYMILGSVAENVAQTSETPVLFVPAR